MSFHRNYHFDRNIRNTHVEQFELGLCELKLVNYNKSVTKQQAHPKNVAYIVVLFKLNEID